MCVEALLKSAIRHMQVLVLRTRHKADRLVRAMLCRFQNWTFLRPNDQVWQLDSNSFARFIVNYCIAYQLVTLLGIYNTLVV